MTQKKTMLYKTYILCSFLRSEKIFDSFNHFMLLTKRAHYGILVNVYGIQGRIKEVGQRRRFN